MKTSWDDFARNRPSFPLHKVLPILSIDFISIYLKFSFGGIVVPFFPNKESLEDKLLTLLFKIISLRRMFLIFTNLGTL